MAENSGAVAGRLRRAQTFLRVLGIDLAISREGRPGSRIIRIRATQENTVSMISSVRDHGDRVTTQSPPQSAGNVPDVVRRPAPNRTSQTLPMQTMLTVLTQSRPLFRGVGNGHSDLLSCLLSCAVWATAGRSNIDILSDTLICLTYDNANHCPTSRRSA